MKRLRLIFLIVTTMSLVVAKAQELVVKDMKPAPMDLSASQYERTDLAGKPCALIKVQLAAYGAQFEGNVIGRTDYKIGEYWVYMSEGSYMLSVKHANFVPLDVNFRNYGIDGVQAKKTYKLTLLMPQVGSGNGDDGMNYLVMTVEPANASVFIDGQAQMVRNGMLSILLPMGEHRYEVSSPAYESKNGTFSISSEKLTLPVRLASAMATLTVSCATSGTQIYVNDELKGNTSWSGSLPAGSYRVEGRLAGYRSYRQNVTLAKLGRQQVTIPALQSVSGNLNVNYQPMNAEVWIDGRKAGSSPDIFRNLKVGRHEVELRANSYKTEKKTVSIKDGQTTMLTGSLEPQTAAQKPSVAQDIPQPVSNSISNSSIETFTVKGVSFNMVRVEGSTFRMGSNDKDAESDEKPVHQVTLSTFYIGETEVTQELWQAVMGSNPSGFKGVNLPVERVSWEDCQEFIRKLNQMTGNSFRLPTEAEWEYAARGGVKSRGYKYSGSKKINNVAWYSGNSGRITHPVKTKQANELGLYDMSGNVWEWCHDKCPDWNNKYSSISQINPIGSSSGAYCLIRGGSWDSIIGDCRSANRSYNTPLVRFTDLGLRLVMATFSGPLETQSHAFTPQNTISKNEHPSTQSLTDAGNEHMEKEYNRAYKLYNAKKYDEAFPIFLELGKSGYQSGDLYFYLGLCYEFGDGVEKNEQQSIYWYEKAFMVDEGRACYRYGCILYKKGNYKKALQCFIKGKNTFWGEAAWRAGQMYEKGEGTAVDIEKAVEMYRLSLLKHIGVSYKYTDSYKALKRLGYPIITEKEIQSITKWDEQNSYIVGQAYEKGDGVEKNQDKAIQMYRESAKHIAGLLKYSDAARALARLGTGMLPEKDFENVSISTNGVSAEDLYQKGIELERANRVSNLPQAFAYFQEAAKAGNAKAIARLGNIYIGESGVYPFKDVEKAISLLKQVVNQNSEACYDLGWYYKNQKNMEKAKYYFHKGCELGDNDGCPLWLGFIFEEEGNYSEALRYFELSANTPPKNQGWAMFKAGEYYESGKGCTKNIQTAIEWYRKSAKTRNSYASNAKNALKRLGVD